LIKTEDVQNRRAELTRRNREALIDAIPNDFLTSEEITLDYLNHASRTKHVFPRHFDDLSIRRLSVNRKKTVERLLSYNKNLGAPERVIQNIEALSHPETYTVMTGQQPSIFSGPLFTKYKAISTITISERL
jgi:uncharacterized protein YllA (UPF0747 family)